MEKRIINPWQWQDESNYVQVVEVKNVQSTLYCSGQAAMYANGKPSDADMETQLRLAINNLETVISEAGYQCSDIVRLNVYTTSESEFFKCFPIFQDWIKRHGIKQALTFYEVNHLFQTLRVELEATAVK